ncbi:hypothetical protein RND81_01G099300 [Saponaria officinalis]|uniref:Uncharacterized protein n=1 Tax=Saponaria officinalis TaxID=3572 RepID=A0AAW1ND71_SAPOF
MNLRGCGQIYDSNDCQESLQRHPPKVIRGLAMDNDVDNATPEVKRECIEEESEGDFGTATLKQLKQACKSKKRKSPKSIKLATVKQEVSDLPCEEDELDLWETLVSWKQKVKKSKSKRKKTFNCGSALSEIDNSGCVSEDTPSSLVLVDISSEISYPLQIKVENPELNPVQPQAISFVHSDENRNLTSEMAETVERCSSDQALKTNLGDPQRSYLNQYFLEYKVQPKSIDTSNCVLNQISYNVIEQMGHDSTFPESSSFEDIRMTEGSVVTDQPSVFCGSDIPREDDMSDPVTCDYHPPSFGSQAATGEENVVTSLDEFKSMVTEQKPSIAVVTSTELQASNCQNGDVEEVALRSPSMDFSPPGQDNKVSLSPICVASLPSITSVVEDEHSSVDNYVVPLSCSPVIQLSDSIGDVMMPHLPERLFSTRKIISPICQQKLRKAMDFDELQDDVEIHSCKEVQLEKTASPGVKRARTIFGSESPETMNAVDLRTKGRKRMRTRNYEGRVPHSIGSVNGSRASQKLQNVGNVSSSVQMCSQNAIAFSKQQIHDIERVATKLMTGLHSMKSIVVDALQHESRTGTKFRYNTDQVRLAVENVGKVEETAKRWLSMMTRDCDRFCKIMTLAEADAPSPEKSKAENMSSPDAKTVPKERKIMFADEVGGSLCKVKVFKNFETDTEIDTPFTY